MTISDWNWKFWNFSESSLCMSHTHKWHNLKKYGTIVKIIFSHAERFESCTTTTRNEYLKSIFCLYSTHSIYPEIKFQIQIVSLFVRIWLTHSFGITVLYTNRTHSIVTRVSSWRPIYSFVDVDSFRTKINLIKM